MRYGPPLQYAFVADRCILYITFSAVVFAERGGLFVLMGQMSGRGRRYRALRRLFRELYRKKYSVLFAFFLNSLDICVVFLPLPPK